MQDVLREKQHLYLGTVKVINASKMMEESWVVIPAKDEAHRLSNVLDAVKKYVPVNKIVVVDDGSSDNTYELAKSKINHVIKHEKNKGKSQALLTGIDFAVLNGAANIIIIDGDGQHDPSDIPVFLASLEGKDIVFGSRHRTKDMPMIRAFGNFCISQLIYILFGIKILDALSGYKAFTRETYQKIRWKNSIGYNVESDILIDTKLNCLKYGEIIISTTYIDNAGITKLDGFKILLNVLRRRFYGSDRNT